MFSIHTFVLVLSVLAGLAAALPYLQLKYDYDTVNSENSERNVIRQFLPYIKRNIAIGRGDGLRPGK